MQKAVILSWEKKQPMVKPLEQFMGSLPRAMLEVYHPPFTFPVVDLFGPLMVKWNCETMCMFVHNVSQLVLCIWMRRPHSKHMILLILCRFISRRDGGSLLIEVDTRIFANSSEKVKVGQDKEKQQIGDVVLIAKDNVLHN